MKSGLTWYPYTYTTPPNQPDYFTVMARAILIAFVCWLGGWAIAHSEYVGLVAGAGVVLVGILFGLDMASIHKNILAETRDVQAERERTKSFTNSTMMSMAEYVGGHPLIPQSRTTVLGLSETEIVVYVYEAIKPKWNSDKMDLSARIQRSVGIPLRNIEATGTGRPKTAREIYDDVRGTTIDVIERSPFLLINFELDGEVYQASFSDFEPPHTALDWHNQITAARYKFRTQQGRQTSSQP